MGEHGDRNTREACTLKCSGASFLDECDQLRTACLVKPKFMPGGNEIFQQLNLYESLILNKTGMGCLKNGRVVTRRIDVEKECRLQLQATFEMKHKANHVSVSKAIIENA